MSEIKHLDLSNTPNNDYQPLTTDVPQQESIRNTPSKLEGRDMSKSRSSMPLVIMAVAVIAGLLTGTGAQRLLAASPSSPLGSTNQPISEVATGTIKQGDVFGKTDEKTFKDSAEGYLEINNSSISEGTHRLVRTGGESQTVYLISSVTDLSKFDGMTVKVWGETFKGQKAGWLMDVGRVQILETQGTAPVEE